MLLGGYCCAYSLWNMGKTAVFLHESTVITARVADMVQYPFESYAQAMAHGNLPWESETAYQATVAFTLPTTPVAISIPKMQLPDLDNRDYRIGQEVDIIVPLTDPARAHLYRWKFQWGADCMLLLLGLGLGGTGYLLLHRRRRRKAPTRLQPRTPKRPKTSNARTPADILPTAPPPDNPARKAKAAKQAAQAASQEVFQLLSDPQPPKKKRSRKPKDPNTPTTPRHRKKKSDA